jgi:hypothetical protein
MTELKVGDRVKVLPGVATPFIGLEGIIQAVWPHDGGIATMDQHIVMFERREKRSFYRAELERIERQK